MREQNENKSRVESLN